MVNRIVIRLFDFCAYPDLIDSGFLLHTAWLMHAVDATTRYVQHSCFHRCTRMELWQMGSSIRRWGRHFLQRMLGSSVCEKFARSYQVRFCCNIIPCLVPIVATNAHTRLKVSVGQQCIYWQWLEHPQSSKQMEWQWLKPDLRGRSMNWRIRWRMRLVHWRKI